MSLIKTQTLHIHRDLFPFPHQTCFQSALLSSLHVGSLNGLLRRRRIVVTRSVIEGRESSSTRASSNRPAHHGKGGTKSKEGAEQRQKQQKLEKSLMLRTDSMDIMGSSSLAPADFCNVEEELDELDDDDELQIFCALVLDLSYRTRSSSKKVNGTSPFHVQSMETLQVEAPLTIFQPINVVNWKRALCLEILEKADVLEYYDQAVLASTRTYYIPAVLRVSSFVHAPKSKKVKLTLNRNNIFLRDKFRCQYCNKREQDLTIDHVLAASRGGGWEWENLVTACATCNVKKGDKSLDECRMKLLKQPREPKELDTMDLPPNYRTFRVFHRNKETPAEWLDYLPNRSFHI